MVSLLSGSQINTNLVPCGSDHRLYSGVTVDGWVSRECFLLSGFIIGLV